MERNVYVSRRDRLVKRWRQFWLARGGYDFQGRVASWLGGLGVGPYRCRYPLAWIDPAMGYVAPSAEIVGLKLQMGTAVFVGERVVIARWEGDGSVELGDRVQLNRETNFELFSGGSIKIGPDSSIQPRCQFTAAVQPILIGARVQIASFCAFYPYDHGMAPKRTILEQPLTSKGPILIDDDAWIGLGVTVLSGVRIGAGAVVGAGSVVTRDIPAAAVAAGNPARVVKLRSELASPTQTIR